MPFPVPNLPQNIGHSRGTVPILFSSFDPILVTEIRQTSKNPYLPFADSVRRKLLDAADVLGPRKHHEVIEDLPIAVYRFLCPVPGRQIDFDVPVEKIGQARGRLVLRRQSLALHLRHNLRQCPLLEYIARGLWRGPFWHRHRYPFAEASDANIGLPCPCLCVLVKARFIHTLHYSRPNSHAAKHTAPAIAAITKSACVRVARRFIRPSTRASKSARATRQTISRPIDFPLDISRILV